MEAGTGADERAATLLRRLEDKRAAVATLEREMEILERQLHNWRMGAEGERLVAAELGRLEAAGWCVLHDVHWPGRPRANIDHVAIGPAGVCVIDAKNWSGAVQVRNGVLTCDGYRKTKEAEGVAEMVAAVATLVTPPHRSSVRGVVAMVQHDLPPSELTGGTVVVGRGLLVDWLLGLPPRVCVSEIPELAGRLRTQLGIVTPTLLTSGSVPTTGGIAESQLRTRRSTRPSPVPPRRRQQSASQGIRERRISRLVLGLAAVVVSLKLLTALTSPAALPAPATGVPVPAATSTQTPGVGATP